MFLTMKHFTPVSICLLALTGFISSLEIGKVMPARYEIENSINRTIEEVERMVRENPTLPKLTRNDIVNILSNITSKDVLSFEDEALSAIEKTREDYQRALMVVLPHKVNNSQENLSALYSKPPVTKIISDDENEKLKGEVGFQPSDTFPKNDLGKSENNTNKKNLLLTTHMRFQQTERPKGSSKPKVAESTVVAKISSRIKSDSAPHKFSLNLEAVDQKPEGSSHTSVATKRPINRGTFSRYRTSTRKPSIAVEVTTSKIKTTTDSQVVTTAAGSKLRTNRWRNRTYAATTTSKSEDFEDFSWKPINLPKEFTQTTVLTSMNNDGHKSNFNENSQEISKINSTTPSKLPQVFVTPRKPDGKKSNVSFKNVPSGFTLTPSFVPTTMAPTASRKEVELLLKSIGLQPSPTNDQNTNVSQNKNLNTPIDNIPYLEKSEVTNNNSLRKENYLIDSQAIRDVRDGVINLSPNIQYMFQQFGFHHSEKSSITTTTTKKPTPKSKVDSYTQFKPIPSAVVKDKEFRDFLARFGLGSGDQRSHKAIQRPIPTPQRTNLLDTVPNDMKNILENIGIFQQKFNVIQSRRYPKFMEKSMNIEEHTVSTIEENSKPHKTKETEQNDKIKNLLTTVRMVQEGKAGIREVQDVAHDLLESTKSLQNGPDPVKLEEILNNYRNSLKNEVKRQTSTTIKIPTTTQLETDETTIQPIFLTESTKNEKNPTKLSFFDTFDISKYVNNTEIIDKSTTAPTSSTSSTEKSNFFDNFDINQYINETEDSIDQKSPNVNTTDLEESFGGSTEAPDPVIPTRPKTGLYFLVDWNTFLRVGEEGKDQVNLRFNPKVGDRSRFRSVQITKNAS